MVALWIVAFIVLFFFIANTVRIVQQYEKGLVETLGKYSRTVGAGVTIVIPIFQSLKKIDMREQVMDVAPQNVITKDNVTVTVDAII